MTNNYNSLRRIIQTFFATPSLHTHTPPQISAYCRPAKYTMYKSPRISSRKTTRCNAAPECDIHQCPGLLIKEEDINIYQIEALEHGTATQGEQIDNAIIILRKSQRYQQRSRQADRQGQKKVDSDQIATITPKSSHTVSICRSQGLINIY